MMKEKALVNSNLRGNENDKIFQPKTLLVNEKLRKR